ncbi:sigma factor-like helix-turn-helix DNA-binding protein [Actinoplanes sp. NPDC051346]|uniref:sigma factor-like helix-turn-helix DNA-binding protein n=1 Tax=Actinoplanes sp. NPDC051346 TaxID=3155048 RepID=UPI003448765D
MLTRHADSLLVGETRGSPMEFLLRSLPTSHLEIIVATYFQGRTTREAARELGLAPDAANARLYQAMRGLSLMVDTYRRVHADPCSADSTESH